MTPELYRLLLRVGHLGGQVLLGIMGLTLLFTGVCHLYEQITNGYEAPNMEALKRKLWANPALNNDQILSQYICPISNRIMMLPVEDPCGHVFDYLSAQELPGNRDICPVSRQAINFSSLIFRVDLCRQIHQRLCELRSQNSPLVKGMLILIRQQEPNPGSLRLLFRSLSHLFLRR